MRTVLTRASNALIVIAIVAALATAAIFTVIPRVLGGEAAVVLTGSMEPHYSPGDVVVTKAVTGAEDIAVGDIIVFQDRPGEGVTPIIHRVISTDTQDGDLVTQGDANGSADDPIIIDQVRGKAAFSVPKLGYASSWVKKVASPAMGDVPSGPQFASLLLGLALILVGLRTLLRKTPQPEPSPAVAAPTGKESQ